MARAWFSGCAPFLQASFDAPGRQRLFGGRLGPGMPASPCSAPIPTMPSRNMPVLRNQSHSKCLHRFPHGGETQIFSRKTCTRHRQPTLMRPETLSRALKSIIPFGKSLYSLEPGSTYVFSTPPHSPESARRSANACNLSAAWGVTVDRKGNGDAGRKATSSMSSGEVTWAFQATPSPSPAPSMAGSCNCTHSAAADDNDHRDVLAYSSSTCAVQPSRGFEG
jgi:hypothetical protein